jgi:hypothetical protein
VDVLDQQPVGRDHEAAGRTNRLGQAIAGAGDFAAVLAGIISSPFREHRGGPAARAEEDN